MIASRRPASSVARAAQCAILFVQRGGEPAQVHGKFRRGIGEHRVRGQPVRPRRIAQDLRERGEPLLHRAKLGGERRCPRACRDQFQARVAHQQFDLPAAETRAEELRGEIRNLVGLIEDHGVRRAEQVTETVFLEREVGQQQVMVDDDDVGLDRLAARLEHVTAADVRAAAPQAVVPRRRDLGAERMCIAEIRQLGEIAGSRGARPALDPHQGAIARAREAALPGELLQPIGAQIVRPPLEQRDPRRHADGARDQRQILVEQLILQGARAG
jgi:hypothetical protein